MKEFFVKKLLIAIRKWAILKKVIILNGSLRKKNTHMLLKKVEALLKTCEVEFVNISDFELKPCIGCENCIRAGICPINDDADMILDKLAKADGIIIGTPVYLRQISGYLKMLIDRGCAWYHRSPLVGKPILFVSTTQVSGLKPTTRYLKDLSVQWGAISTGVIARNMFKLDEPVKVVDLKVFNSYLEDDTKTNYRPTLKNVIEFNTQKVLAVSVLPVDLAFWREKNYVDKPYFFSCRISIFKRCIGYLYYKMLSYFINKNKL